VKEGHRLNDVIDGRARRIGDEREGVIVAIGDRSANR